MIYLIFYLIGSWLSYGIFNAYQIGEEHIDKYVLWLVTIISWIGLFMLYIICYRWTGELVHKHGIKFINDEEI